MAARCFFPRDGGGHRHQSKAVAEALEKLHHGGRVVSSEEVSGGAVRVKIVVRKRELKQMVSALGGAAPAAGERHGNHRPREAGGSASAEQRLHALRRRSVRRVLEAERRTQGDGEWEPCLQSIPEEVY